MTTRGCGESIQTPRLRSWPNRCVTMGGEHPLAAMKRLAHWEVGDDLGMLRTRLACISAQADKITEQAIRDAQVRVLREVDAEMSRRFATPAFTSVGAWRGLQDWIRERLAALTSEEPSR